MSAKDIGIDLGTANVLIYVKGRGVVLNEPSIVVIDTETKSVIAVGNEAKEMLGRTPGKIKAIKPMKDGVIADFELTEIMLNSFIKKIKARNLFFRPRILICCPTNITPVEKNAIREAAEQTGARKVYIEEEPKVAAIGAGMDISKPTANMVLDIGGGTTDIAVLSLNGIVSSSSIKTAGNTLDQDIIKYIKEKYKLLIGEQTAEDIKINFANVYKPSKKEKLEIKGRDLITGLPKAIEINQEETKTAMTEGLNKIVKECKNVLEKTPPELSADIVEKGVILTGGGSLLTGLVEVLEEELTIPVLIAETPLTCVAEGTGILLNNIKLLEEDQ
ncbi:MAG: rod shape-determining protein [Bacilli bacterium]|nr:rod shape-determining protein [Bacilli bacterium]MBQ6404680.1 rod shape-determining protein [Bacilli bacterium]